MNTTLTSLALAGALLAAPSLPAHAAVTVYTTQSAFIAQLGAFGTDSFDDLAADALVNPPVTTSTGNSFPRAAGSFGYSLNVGTWYTLFNNRAAANPADVRLSPENAARALNFDTFAKPVLAIGANFFITDVWGADAVGKAVRITVTDINNAVTSLTVTNTTAATYRGFVSTVAIKSLSVIADKPLEDNWATMNDLTLGTVAAPVPEPGTAWLAALGAAGVLAWRRRSSPPADRGRAA